MTPANESLAQLEYQVLLDRHVFPPGVAVSTGRVPTAVTRARPSYITEHDWAGCERMSPARKEEFIAGRKCAAEALVALQSPSQHVDRGDDRSPGWPADVVGSISHSHGLCWAACAPAQSFAGVGIDVERIRHLTGDVLDVITTQDDQAHAAQLQRRHGPIPWELIMFSAKESTYKVWHPITGTWLGYLDAHVVLSPDTETFTVEVLVDAPAHLRTLTGRYSVNSHFVSTSIALSATV